MLQEPVSKSARESAVKSVRESVRESVGESVGESITTELRDKCRTPPKVEAATLLQVQQRWLHSQFQLRRRRESGRLLAP